jgi:hypothetical protein
MYALSQWWQRRRVRLVEPWGGESERHRHLQLLLDLPVVPRRELYVRLQRVTPPRGRATLVVGWSTEMSQTQAAQRLWRWERVVVPGEFREGPTILDGVANYPCLFRRRQDPQSRLDCEVYRVGYDRYIEWEREETRGHG